MKIGIAEGFLSMQLILLDRFSLSSDKEINNMPASNLTLPNTFGHGGSDLEKHCFSKHCEEPNFLALSGLPDRLYSTQRDRRQLFRVILQQKNYSCAEKKTARNVLRLNMFSTVLYFITVGI